MKRLLLATMTLVCWASLVVGSASAQSPLAITPGQLSLSGVQDQRLTRTLLLQSNTELLNIQVTVLELTSEQGHSLLPEIASDSPSLPTDLASNAGLSLPITFDLGSAQPGIYSGELLISYAGGSQIVPVQIAVKAKPWWPLLALIAGVALGIGVSTYRAKGRPRDEMMVRLGQIRTQMKVDEELHTLGSPFLNRITATLVDIETAMEAQQWEQAQLAAEKAAQLWKNWRRDRPDWIVLLTAYDEFTKWVATIAADTRYGAELLQAAQDYLRNAPDVEGPQAFRAQLGPLREKANAYVSLMNRLQTLSAMGMQGNAQAEAYRRQLYALSPVADDFAQKQQALTETISAALARLRLAELNTLLATYRDLAGSADAEFDAYQTQIDALTPDADAAYFELRDRLTIALEVAARSGLDAAEAKCAEDHDVGSDEATVRRLGQAADIGLIKTLPQIRVQTLEAETLAAGRRLRGFTWLTYGVTVGLLALAGFVELYSTRPDFGANGAGDFFALLAWGFGAEATRSAIADMVQSWGIVRQ